MLLQFLISTFFFLKWIAGLHLLELMMSMRSLCFEWTLQGVFSSWFFHFNFVLFNSCIKVCFFFLLFFFKKIPFLELKWRRLKGFGFKDKWFCFLVMWDLQGHCWKLLKQEGYFDKGACLNYMEFSGYITIRFLTIFIWIFFFRMFCRLIVQISVEVC